MVDAQSVTLVPVVVEAPAVVGGIMVVVAETRMLNISLDQLVVLTSL